MNLALLALLSFAFVIANFVIGLSIALLIVSLWPPSPVNLITRRIK